MVQQCKVQDHCRWEDSSAGSTVTRWNEWWTGTKNTAVYSRLSRPCRPHFKRHKGPSRTKAWTPQAYSKANSSCEEISFGRQGCNSLSLYSHFMWDYVRAFALYPFHTTPIHTRSNSDFGQAIRVTWPFGCRFWKIPILKDSAQSITREYWWLGLEVKALSHVTGSTSFSNLGRMTQNAQGVASLHTHTRVYIHDSKRIVAIDSWLEWLHVSIFGRNGLCPSALNCCPHNGALAEERQTCASLQQDWRAASRFIATKVDSEMTECNRSEFGRLGCTGIIFE